MTAPRSGLKSILSLVLGAYLAACGSDTGLGPDYARIASASVSPAHATISSGGATTVTAAFTAFGGLKINKIVVSRAYAGISITEKSQTRAGATITKVFVIHADSTIPAGEHEISFRPSVTENTGSPAPEIRNAIFTLTVTR